MENINSVQEFISLVGREGSYIFDLDIRGIDQEEAVKVERYIKTHNLSCPKSVFHNAGGGNYSVRIDLVCHISLSDDDIIAEIESFIKEMSDETGVALGKFEHCHEPEFYEVFERRCIAIVDIEFHFKRSQPAYAAKDIAHSLVVDNEGLVGGEYMDVDMTFQNESELIYSEKNPHEVEAIVFKDSHLFFYMPDHMVVNEEYSLDTEDLMDLCRHTINEQVISRIKEVSFAYFENVKSLDLFQD
jgi:hypothetical protein